MVGAVVVRDGQIVGKGYHPYAGAPHAEVFALRDAGDLARGACLYVTLEPCCHHGKTPPCADVVIESGVSEVVAAMVDPNPLVSGKGLAKIEAAGIKTTVGVLEEEARKLNESFIKHVTTGLPFITLKMAMTLDGKIATRTGDSKWITGKSARRYVHRLRRSSDAVLVGIGTVLADDPELTVRLCRPGKKCPARVVVDAFARTPVDAKIFSSDGQVILAVTNSARDDKILELEKAGAVVLRIDGRGGFVNLRDLALKLGEMGVQSILIEGGGELAAGALESKVVDKVLTFIAPKIAGGKSAKTPVEGNGAELMSEAISLKDVRIRRFGQDIAVEGYPDYVHGTS
jgi:diaminohydroxyphosphoribosylaminopyrimidine deaminase/5-amino-6-(5-phosphoribosylamino)uracil reductase